MKITAAALGCLMAITSLAQLKYIQSGVNVWSSHPVTEGAGRQTRKISEGTSTHLDYLEIHATTQFPGAVPGKAHANDDVEECIIVKEGLAKVTIENKSVVLGPEGVILLMPKQMHAIQNVGNSNLTYYVMRYRSKLPMNIERGLTSGGSLILNADSLTFKPGPRGGGRAYFDRPTAMCERFEMHTTRLNGKGPSHEPHTHPETEIIWVLSGQTEMTIDGKEYKGSAGDFYFTNSGEKHGIRNSTDKVCSYFAFKWQ